MFLLAREVAWLSLLWWCSINSGSHLAEPREIQGQERRQGEGRGRGDLEDPRQAGELSCDGEKSGITGGAAPCPTAAQHIRIQAEICGVTVKLGGQLQ